MVQPSLGAIISSVLLGSFPGFDSNPAPVANLTGIGQYRGTRLSKSISGFDLPSPVDAWLGVDYALQPVGERRFAPVEQPPERFDGVRDAARFGPVCPQGRDHEHADAEQSEACLNFNVYRPAGVPLTERLPTLVWIHGGAFSLYSGRTMDGGAFVASSARQPLMVVTFNYRLGALGFLPSGLFARLGLLNLGLRDQHFFLRFVRDHLAEFGGDPDRVTLGGLSAGAHAAAFAYFHNYGEDEGAPPLFARVILQSGAVTARAFPDVENSRYEADFRSLMAHVGCDDADADASDEQQQLGCLRAAPVEAIEQVSSRTYAEAESSLSWPWQPVPGGPRMERRGSRVLSEGSFHALPLITTHTTDEGKHYTPGHLQTNDEFLRFWQALSPGLNVTDLAILNELYPDPAAHRDSRWAARGPSPNGTQYDRLSAAWSDMAYICPSRATARATGQGNTWRLRFDTPGHPLEASGWRGVPHGSDAAYFWNEARVPFPRVAREYHAYMASFVAAGDPNRFRAEGAPEWPRYGGSEGGGGGGGGGGGCARQLVVSPGRTGVECDDVRVRHCEFWNDEERAVRLQK